MSYESPISIIYGDMQTKLEGDVFKAIQNCNIEVNKDELLKALAYDRNQYHKGWLDGYAQAAEEIVHCKYCKHAEHWYGDKYRCFLWSEGGIDVFEEGYCNYGESKEDEQNF